MTFNINQRATWSGLRLDLVEEHPDQLNFMQRAAARSSFPGDDPPRLLARLPIVLRETGLGRSTIYRLIADGSFPPPVRHGPRAVAWRWLDIDQWTRSRPATH